MNIEIDTHAHTLVSGHAYNTIREMAQMAAEKGLKGLALTEHAPAMPGSTNLYYFQNLRIVPREMYGVKLLLGTELNILDDEGNVDLPENVVKSLDIAIASIHPLCFQEAREKVNIMSAYRNAMEHPWIDIIGHPDDGIYPLEYEPIVEAAKETNTLLEVNNNSLNPVGSRKHTRENLIAMLELCKEYKQPVIMNSDSHVFCDVARRDFSEKLIKEIDFPEELIVNRSVDVFKEYIHRKYKEK